MSFISHAQNLEDVMLFRALGEVRNGFYIDVGAAWPEHDSVTQAFYERGWSGINIEPNPAFHTLLASARPRDINLQVAVGNCAGTAQLNLIAGTGLSTLDRTIATQHGKAGWQTAVLEVRTLTLAMICESHVASDQEIHFLKVDVEGHEGAVLSGLDWNRWRPWVVLVEATVPMTQKENHVDWEATLHNANYRFVWADGLNRFYIAAEKHSLHSAFRYPPNVFDDYQTAAMATSLAHAESLNTRLDALREELESYKSKLGSTSSLLAENAGQLARAQSQLASTAAQLAGTTRQLGQKAHEAEHWWRLATEQNRELDALRKRLPFKLSEIPHRWKRSYHKRSERLAAAWRRWREGLRDPSTVTATLEDVGPMLPSARHIHDELKRAIAADLESR